MALYPVLHDDQGKLIKYEPTSTGHAFHLDNSFVRGIMGPLGSSKSTMCCMEVLMRAHEQEPFNGIRATRWVFVRKTFGELTDTTLKTWQDWCPDSICPVKMSKPMHGFMRRPHHDGTIIEMEIIFLALDQEDDVQKLRSLDLTGVWINEAKEIHKAHLDMATGRVGRFPAEKDGGATWCGVIMDTNPPHVKHWWYEHAEEIQPEGWRFYRQPTAVFETGEKDPLGTPLFCVNYGQMRHRGIPAAENLINLRPGYYEQQLAGKKVEWIRINLGGEYAKIIEGKPIYSEYNDLVHVSSHPLEIQKGLPVIVGMDFGLFPCAVMIQMTMLGQLRVIDELCGTNVALRSFVRDQLRPYMADKYAGVALHYVVDPAGGQREQGEGHTLINILSEEGIFAETSGSDNRFTARREAVASFLMSWRDDRPGMIISPNLDKIRTGFQGGYQFRQIRSAEGLVDTNEAVKNEYSHPHDALQYAVMAVKHGYQGGSSEVVGHQGNVRRAVSKGRTKAFW